MVPLVRAAVVAASLALAGAQIDCTNHLGSKYFDLTALSGNKLEFISIDNDVRTSKGAGRHGAGRTGVNEIPGD